MLKRLLKDAERITADLDREIAQKKQRQIEKKELDEYTEFMQEHEFYYKSHFYGKTEVLKDRYPLETLEKYLKNVKLVSRPGTHHKATMEGPDWDEPTTYHYMLTHHEKKDRRAMFKEWYLER